jgi:anti-sigma factor RsiW
MTCTEAQDLLSDYIDDELASGARGHVESHLAGCEPCRTQHKKLRRTVRFVQTHGDAMPDVTPAGVAYAGFSRALVDESYGRTPAELLIEAVRMIAPELMEGVRVRLPGQEESS